MTIESDFEAGKGRESGTLARTTGMTNTELSSLLRQAAGNPNLDRATRERLAGGLHERCTRFLRRKRLDHATIDDLTQTIVLHVLEVLPSMREVLDEPLGWLSRVEKNKFLDDRRKHQLSRLRFVALDDPETTTELSVDVAVGTASVEALVDFRRVEGDLRAAAQLAGKRRHQVEAFVRLKVWRESAQEVADALVASGSAPHANVESVWKWGNRAVPLLEAIGRKTGNRRLEAFSLTLRASASEKRAA